jgi:hypothetical protein
MPSPAIVLMPGTTAILRMNGSVFFSGLAASAVTVYITLGQGL